ncbi:hypothetical protein KR018_007705 [Drosophila ironensis]|nr:hypothetical protein KR018_007705 [Drosophila ironensis]
MEEIAGEAANGPPVDPPQPQSVLCPICNEFYRANDVISATVCGHVFHRQCLNRWLVRSPTCPQCRSNCHSDLVHRIRLYFPDSPEDEPSRDPPKPPYEWVPICLDAENRPDEAEDLKTALECGTDEDERPAYVARVYLGHDLLPASYIPERGVALASWACQAYELTDQVQLLLLYNCKYTWLPGQRGSVPQHALKTGYSSIGDPTFTGRCVYEDKLRLAKVHPTHKMMYMPHRGQEIGIEEYDVLAVTTHDGSFAHYANSP